MGVFQVNLLIDVSCTVVFKPWRVQYSLCNTFSSKWNLPHFKERKGFGQKRNCQLSNIKWFFYARTPILQGGRFLTEYFADAIHASMSSTRSLWPICQFLYRWFITHSCIDSLPCESSSFGTLPGPSLSSDNHCKLSALPSNDEGRLE